MQEMIEETQRAIERWRSSCEFEVAQAADFMSRALRHFWAYHARGQRVPAATLLHLVCDEEFDLNGDCEIGGEISERLGYDDDEGHDLWQVTTTRERREQILADTLSLYPLG